MLTMRRRKNEAWMLWRGGFLRYANTDETDFSTIRDQWACEWVESLGLDPTVRPGKSVYMKLCDSIYKTYVELQSMAIDYRLYWTPPAMRPDPDLAKILNALIGNEHKPVSPEDAALRMASYNERIEAHALENGIKLARCNVPAFRIMHLIDSALDGAISSENIRRCLSAYAKMNAEDLEVV